MTTGSVSPRRADTRRNHERILTAAATALAGSGEISFNAIAKQAGVGVGTVYRHFPNPEALVVAVYRRELQHLVDVVPELLAQHSPDLAFRIWTTDHLVRYMMTKRGLAKALGAAASSHGEMLAKAHESMAGAVTTLLEANIQARTVRPDLEPETLIRGLGGLFFLDPSSDWRAPTEKLIDLLWRGMSADNPPPSA
ncbi:DNA-binding transcriptional regulator, AcrR family [Saccharopolyspora antimicrobica]|uniref:DNA-binding transcriptional regulator, AcrR family n=1 Tax=Saccharopolyspora antimicrobica TaxID=455193 RepID=A0A1I4R6Y6_9PSEU|nr:TetR/AcrR family transcriptional regulator [Saccharopolyspora antimicrobica]RKT88153.1 TetR family transcriptional regulator [Saccharopolyspora antimicrobica]SFM47710.1 DNA-binding transcriptional regulator, AcrR family [Saccharopolyspora antimicrobica]